MPAKKLASATTSTSKKNAASPTVRTAAKSPAKPAAERSGFWLVKSEPFKYAYAQLEKDKRTVWDGVRNFEARNHLRAMKKGDLLLFYHSNEGKEIVGIAKVLREAFQDPTTEEDWSVVEVGPVRALARPVTLDEVRTHALLGQMQMIRRNRLSVTTVTAAEFETILTLSGTKL
jgi:predicted RNA-binding protein with PUA-like domain